MANLGSVPVVGHLDINNAMLNVVSGSGSGVDSPSVLNQLKLNELPGEGGG